MIAFLLSMLALVLAVLATLLWPLLRRPAAGAASGENPALKVLREQRAELEAERSAGRIDEAAYAQTLGELERRALDEASAPEAAVANAPARGWAVVLAVALPLASLALYLVLGNPAGVDPANTAPQQQARITPEQIDAMVASLAAKVKANPDDVEGAQMLGRSYMVLGRYAQAVEVFSGLATKLPQDAQVLADWADALASANDQKLAGEPEKLIQRALALDPGNVKALALAGTLAYEKGDYKNALGPWEKILGHVDPQSDFGRSIQAMANDARQRAGMPVQAAAAAQSPQLAQAEPVAAAASGIQLKGHVTLAAALKAEAKPDDTVFVFLRPAEGGRPIAALRLSVADLPTEVDFAKASLMLQGPLPDKLVAGARISRSGNPLPQSGDLQGLSERFSPGAGEVQIAIDQKVP